MSVFTAIQLPEAEGGYWVLSKDSAQHDLDRWEGWGCKLKTMKATEEPEAIKEFKESTPSRAAKFLTGQTVRNIQAWVRGLQ